MRKFLKKSSFVPDKLVTDDLRSYRAAAGHWVSQTAMTAVDGVITGPRIRISRPDDGSARFKGSRAWDRRKEFSQRMRRPKTPSTSSVISPQQAPSLQGGGDADVARSRCCGVSLT